MFLFFFLIVKNLFAQGREIEDKFYEMIIRPREIWNEENSRQILREDLLRKIKD